MQDKEIMERTRRTEWFRHDRFGMFIHWGLYAIPARGEWVRSTEEMPEEPYLAYFREFTADRYDPKEWARLARQAGMRYAVLTAKHHDGFCLFDSQLTDYKSTNTPCGRDLVREFLDAFPAGLAPPGLPPFRRPEPSPAEPPGGGKRGPGLQPVFGLHARPNPRASHQLRQAGRDVV